MPKKYNDRIKATAWTYYVVNGMTAEEISEIMEPNATTIRRWADEEDWEKQKTVRLISPAKIALDALWNVGLIYQKARDEGRPLDASETNRIAQQNKFIERLDKDLAFVSNAIESQGMFMDYVKKRNRELFDEIVGLSMEFTQELAEKFGDL